MYGWCFRSYWIFRLMSLCLLYACSLEFTQSVRPVSDPLILREHAYQLCLLVAVSKIPLIKILLFVWFVLKMDISCLKHSSWSRCCRWYFNLPFPSCPRTPHSTMSCMFTHAQSVCDLGLLPPLASHLSVCCMAGGGTLQVSTVSRIAGGCFVIISSDLL